MPGSGRIGGDSGAAAMPETGREKYMTDQQFREIRAAIQYMDMKPGILSRFYNVKELLYQEIRKDPEAYKAETLFPDPMNGNKIVKCVNLLNAKYTKKIVKFDLTGEDAAVPAEAADLLQSVEVTEHDGTVGLTFHGDFEGDVWLNIPRSNSVTLRNTAVRDVTFDVMGAFNPYQAEGFTLALRRPDLKISIEPAALDGIKGSGEVYVYVLTGDTFYRDRAAKYFTPDPILKVFRG